MTLCFILILVVALIPDNIEGYIRIFLVHPWYFRKWGYGWGGFGGGFGGFGGGGWGR